MSLNWQFDKPHTLTRLCYSALPPKNQLAPRLKKLHDPHHAMAAFHHVSNPDETCSGVTYINGRDAFTQSLSIYIGLTYKQQLLI
jgi:hypothetical protein